MLEYLSIKNFQAHKSLDIEFSAGITSIVGASDTGKSAIIRALKWVVMNKPSGMAFLRYGSKSVTVEVDVDGKVVKRERSASKNLYQVDDRELEAFGNEVPKEVVELFNLSDINFQSQHDAPFWFSETAGEVSRQLNQIIDLSIIDRTLSGVAGELRKARTEVEVREKSLSEALERQKQLRDAKRMSRDWDAVKTTKKELDQATQTHQRAFELVQGVLCNRDEGLRALRMAELAHLAVEKGSHWVELQDHAADLSEIIKNIKKSEKIANAPLPDITSVEHAGIRLKEAQEKLKGLEDLLDKIEDEGKAQCQKEKEARAAEKEWRKEMGEQCPLCGNPLT